MQNIHIYPMSTSSCEASGHFLIVHGTYMQLSYEWDINKCRFFPLPNYTCTVIQQCTIYTSILLHISFVCACCCFRQLMLYAITFNIITSAAAYGFYCGAAATCACFRILFNAFSHSCGHLANPGYSSGFLAAISLNSSCSYPATPSCPCNQLATCGQPCGYITSFPIQACSSHGCAYLL